MRLRRPVTVLALVTAVVAASCTSEQQNADSGSDPVEWVAPGALPCSRVTTTSAPRPTGSHTGPLRIEYLAEAAFAGRIGNVKLWDRFLVYAPDDRGVVVCDLRTGRVARIARLDNDSPGAISLPAVSRSTVAYLEQSTVPDIDAPGKGGRTEWTIPWVDVRSGRRGIVARSAGRAGIETRYELLPRPRLDWPWLAWLEGVGADDDPAPRRRLHVHDLRSRRTRVVGEFSGTRNAALTDGTIVYDRPTGNADQGARRDLFAVSADGSGEARQLTHSGNVHSFWAANGQVAWQEPPARDGASDVWVMPVSGDAEPGKVGRGRSSVPGPDFVVADTIGHLALFDPAHPGTPPVHLVGGSPGSLDPSSYWAVSGNLVVWVTNDHPPGPELKRHLHVARVVRDP